MKKYPTAYITLAKKELKRKNKTGNKQTNKQPKELWQNK